MAFPPLKHLDVVVADVMMPGMNGPQLVARLRAYHPNVRVLYVSALPGVDLIEKGILEPDAPFLQKPFDLDDIWVQLQAIFRNERPAPPHTTGRTILLVDDNEAALSALRDHLDDLGYRVRAFSKPRKALQAAALEPDIALLLSDMRMPEMRGDELGRRLRESRPGLPIVFMSGLVEPDALPNATYAKKPIDLDDLEGMIASILA